MLTHGNTFEWYYIGHFGQLGPLSLEQMRELARDGVIEAQTYVWRSGMPEWVKAETVPELRSSMPLSVFSPAPPPPPPPSERLGRAPSSVNASSIDSVAALAYPQIVPKSDKSSVLAGILNVLFPGIGRMYLGYFAHGIFQLFLTPFGCGIGWVWSVIDGIILLCGGVKLDGYGRRLSD